MTRQFLGATLCAAACLTALPAAAQFQKPEDEIKYRKAAFTLMAAHFGRVGAMVQGRTPWDAQVAAANMAVVSAVHALPMSAFGAGTDKGDTRALPVVWSKSADFKAAGDKLVDAVGKLDAAVKTGNLDNVKAAFGPAANACKDCHDNFRAK